MQPTDPRDAQIAALREALVRSDEIVASLPCSNRDCFSSRCQLQNEVHAQAQRALAAAPAAKRDVPCKTPSCNYAMVPLEEDGWYICTKCRAVHQVAAKQEVGE